MEYNILIYDQFPVIRKALSYIIKKNFKQSNVVVANDVDELFVLSMQIKFHLIFLDIVNNDINSLQLFKKIKITSKGCKIIIFSDTSSNIFNNKLEGVTLLDKNSSELKIIQYIRLLLDGEHYFTDSLTLESYSNAKKETKTFLEEIDDMLSERELECAILLIQGYTIVDISKKLFLAVTTISTYKRRVLDKTNTKNIIELSDYFRNRNLRVLKNKLISKKKQ